MGVEQEAPLQITGAEGRQRQSARASEGDRDMGLGPESRDVSQLSGPLLPVYDSETRPAPHDGRAGSGEGSSQTRERSTKGGVGFKVGGTPSGGRARVCLREARVTPKGPAGEEPRLLRVSRTGSRAAPPACWFARPAPHGCLPVYCPSPHTRSRAPGGQPWVPSA